MPRLSERQRATPCESGSADATSRTPRGSWSSAKNVPENMYIGITHEAEDGVDLGDRPQPTAQAAAGAAKARPVRSAAGSAASTHQPAATPNSAITATNAALEVSRRKAMKSRWPARISPGSSGVVAAVR